MKRAAFSVHLLLFSLLLLLGEELAGMVAAFVVVSRRNRIRLPAVRGQSPSSSCRSFFSLPSWWRNNPFFELFFASSSRQAEKDDRRRLPQIREQKYRELMDASTLSLAPMMEYTDRHFRHLVRLISSRTLLYTEMVAANAIAHERADRISDYKQQQQTKSSSGDNDNDNDDDATVNYDDRYLRRFLAQSVVVAPQQESATAEGPCVLQLGGSDPHQLRQAAQGVMELTARGHCDYTAINLNCGCPSPKVAGKGCFGAALMDEPKLVAELTQAIHEGCQGRLPVTVKCRIGTDSQRPFTKLGYEQHVDPEEEYQQLCRFLETVASNGVVTDFSIHARIAVLQKSFSPADNRKIPPLKYDVVRRLVRDYPELTFTLNGGVETISQVQEELEAAPGLKGVMIGRAFAADPWSFAMADEMLYGDDTTTTTKPNNRLEILEAYGRHADAEEEIGDPTKIRRFICKAVSPLFAGEANAKRYRIALDEIAGLPKKLQSQGTSLAAGQPPLSELILSTAMKHLSEETLLRTPQESYERMLWEEEKRKLKNTGERSSSVNEWQARRKEEESTSFASISCDDRAIAS